VIRREDLAKSERRAKDGMGAHPARIDTESLQGNAHILAEAVVADLGHHCGAAAEAGGGDRHVGRAAAQRLVEGPDFSQRHPYLLGVQVHADPAHRHDLEFRSFDHQSIATTR
jgi:hypothetical protein